MSDPKDFLTTQTGTLLEKESEDRFWLNMGPQHPSTHGVFRILLETEGEIVKNVVPIIGYLHRGVEKISENREWMGALPLTDRMDYLGAMSNNMALTLPVEELMELEVPRRAQWLRVLALETNRLASHLLFYGTLGLDLGALTPFFFAFRQREIAQYLLELLSGQRITFNYIRYGGVRLDITTPIEREFRKFITGFRPAYEEMWNLVEGNEIFRTRIIGVGESTPELLIKHGVTGPILRASGVKRDLRKDRPFAAYDEFDFDVITHDKGDTYSRWYCRYKEMGESLKIIEQCLDGMPDGPHIKKMPFFFKPPPGEIYSVTDTPRGDLGVYIVSDGSRFPYRVRYRAPSFCNLSVLSELLYGTGIGDVIAILGSFDPVFGEVDR